MIGHPGTHRPKKQPQGDPLEPDTSHQANPDTPRRTVHFSQGGIKGGAGLLTGSSAVIPWLILYGVGLCLVGFLMLANYPWLPRSVRVLLVSVVFLALLVALVRALARGYRRTMSALKLTIDMDPAADVNVICWPDQIKPMKKLIPDDEGAFEPEIFRVWKTTRRSMMSFVDNKAARVRLIVWMTLWPLTLNGLIQLAVHRVIDVPSLLAAIAVLLLIPVIWSFIHPAYLRIAPGRVDIVRFGFVGSKPTIEAHSLRDLPVRLDLRRKELLIGGWHPTHPDAQPDSEDDEELTEADMQVMRNAETKDPQAMLGTLAQRRALKIIPLWATLEQGRLERAVFRAAVSTAEPGPLPDDALIG